eukprot:scaffold125680_cov35-Prasinocladus_malaysianus.AAC.1
MILKRACGARFSAATLACVLFRKTSQCPSPVDPCLARARFGQTRHGMSRAESAVIVELHAKLHYWQLTKFESESKESFEAAKLRPVQGCTRRRFCPQSPSPGPEAVRAASVGLLLPILYAYSRSVWFQLSVDR